MARRGSEGCALWRQNCEKLTPFGNSSKALLRHYDPEGTGLSLYRKYFNNITDDTTSEYVPAIGSIMNKSVLEKYFGAEDEIPAHFDISYPPTVTRLSELVRRNIVIYFASSATNSELTFFHDTSIWSLVEGNDYPTDYFVFDGTEKDLYFARDLPIGPVDQMFGNKISMSVPCETGPYRAQPFEQLLLLFGLDGDRVLDPMVRTVCNEKVTSFLTLLEETQNGGVVSQFMPFPILFVTVTRVNTTNPRARSTKGKFRYFYLTPVAFSQEPHNSNAKSINWSSVETVVLAVDRSDSVAGENVVMMRPSKDFDDFIKSDLGIDPPSVTEATKKPIESQQSQSVRELLKQMEKETREKEKARNVDDSPTCQCKICQDPSYEENLGKNNQGDKLYTIQDTAYSLLKTLGWEDVKADTGDEYEGLTFKERVREAASLSTTAYDCESYFVKVLAEHNTSAADATDKLFDTVPRRRRYIEQQKPLLILILNYGLHKAQGEDFRTAEYLELENESPEGHDMLALKFLHSLMEIRDKVSEMKRRLFEPIHHRILAYYAVHLESYAMLPTDAEKAQYCNAWKATFFGKLQRQLEDLESSLFVFSFNGSRYDHVLLGKYRYYGCCSGLVFNTFFSFQLPTFFA